MKQLTTGEIGVRNGQEFVASRRVRTMNDTAHNVGRDEMSVKVPGRDRGRFAGVLERRGSHAGEAQKMKPDLVVLCEAKTLAHLTEKLPSSGEWRVPGRTMTGIRGG